MNKKYREGAIGALMDEYERASLELMSIIDNLQEGEFDKILDSETSDEDCRSIKTIMTHIIRSGYGYANRIRKVFEMEEDKPSFQVNNPADAMIQFNKMLEYSVKTLEGKWKMSDDEIYSTIIETSWGGKLSLEALLEHAIVHILRHRRQIEKLTSQTKV